MSGSSDKIVEVIVWEGIFYPFNPWGHVSTKIKVGGTTYSYSLEDPKPPKAPHDVCNTEAFKFLRKDEQYKRNGVGFILNITEEQASIIYMSMQRRFHAYNSPSCKYEMHDHNCTYAIQKAMLEAGIKFKRFISHNPLSYVEYTSKKSTNQTMLPAFVEQALLETKNNGGWLVKDIISYPKGKNYGEKVNSDKVDLLFELKAMHNDKGWHSVNGALENRWDPIS